MRVIAGTAKGRTLKTPDGMLTRPTAERVKEAVFSAVQFDLPGAKVLDLFAGTGQLGIEALSRGGESHSDRRKNSGSSACLFPSPFPFIPLETALRSVRTRENISPYRNKSLYL